MVKGFYSPFRLAAEKIGKRQPIAHYTPQQLAQARESCRRALSLAEKLDKPEPSIEAQFLLALVQMHEKLNALSDRLQPPDLSPPATRQQVQEAFAAFKSAVEAMLTAKARQIDLWKAEPADFVEKPKKEIRAQWEKVLAAMQSAVDLRMNPTP